MAKTKRAAKQPPLRDADTENRILEAACRVFIKHGTAGARMQEIAREAGVNQALLHYYFRTKERLSVAVFGLVARRMFPGLIQILGSDATLDKKIDGITGLYLDTLTKSPFIPGYLIAEMHHHPDRLPQLLSSALGTDPSPIVAGALSRLETQIHTEVAAGRMRPITPEEFAINLMALCIFPFAARPMISFIFGMDDPAFSRFIKKRKTALPELYKRVLRP